MDYSVKEKRLYLRLGDRATHLLHEEWGEGAVVEERTSIVPGGTCLVRLLFEDGRQRTFNNDLDNEQCCYFFGIRRVVAFSLEDVGDVGPVRARATRRRRPVRELALKPARPERRRLRAP